MAKTKNLYKVIIDGEVLDFEETVALLCETRNDLKNANSCISQYAKETQEMECVIEEQKNQISELETELRVKEDLLKIQSELKNGESLETVEIDGEYRRLMRTENGVVEISNLPHIEESRPSIEWYEERHQSDCITINQLHTTIDVLIDKLARLREVKGL